MAESAPAPVPFSPLWHGLLVTCLVSSLVGAGFLVFGEFGGWYYLHTYYEVRQGFEGAEWQRLTSDNWDSDGLFTEAAIAAPLAMALIGLLVSAGITVTLLREPATHPRKRLLVAGASAGAALLLMAGTAAAWIWSMEDGTEWWLSEAFWTPFFCSLGTTLALLYLVYVRKVPSPVDLES